MRWSETVAPSAVLLLVMTGCATGAQEAPNPVDQVSTSPAAPSSTPTNDPATLEPTPSPTELNQDFQTFLVDSCLRDVQQVMPPRDTRETFVEQARVEIRDVDPPWLIYIPAHDSDPEFAVNDLAYLCVYEGDADGLEAWALLDVTALSDNELEGWIVSNINMSE